MSKKIAILHHTLDIGGGEKLVSELAIFYTKQQFSVTVFIPDNLNKEYYDEILKNQNIKVVRFNAINKKNIFKKRWRLTDLIWNYKIRYALQTEFDNFIFVNLINSLRYRKHFRHDRIIHWHTGNKIQYKDAELPFNKNLFNDETIKIVFFNEYQKIEIEDLYGPVANYEIIKLFENE